jgi:phospholipid transport system transporter-binding protein
VSQAASIEATAGGFRVRAPMTIARARELLAAGSAAIAAAEGRIEIDLSPVAEVDSAALAVLFAWLRQAGDRRIALVGAPPPLQALAGLYGVNELLPSA